MTIFRKYIFAICFITVFISCNKKNNFIEESQGTNFNLLLKTVMSGPNIAHDETVNYSYNSSGQLSEIYFNSKDNNTGKFFFTSEKFFRTAAGRLDSIIYKTESGGVTMYKTRTLFYFNPAGIQTYSLYINETGYSPGGIIPVFDSSLYTYSGSRVIQRTDFRRFNTDPYFSLRTFNYNYDGAGNLMMLRSAYTTNPGIDTVFLTFDNKINPLPALRNINEIGYWGPGFYNDYSFKNNPLSRKSNDSDNFIYEYRYAPNDKPLYQKIKATGSTWYAEVYYYYD